MEGKTLWVQADDVDGPLDEGRVVKATRSLNDFCLRGDDGSAPLPPGTLLEIIETRPWGRAMAQELPALSTADEAHEGRPVEHGDHASGAGVGAAWPVRASGACIVTFPTGKVEVEVTQEAIDAGNRAVAYRLSRECNCPVAHALADAGFPNPKAALNTFSAGPVLKAAVDDRRLYPLPNEASRFITSFDCNEHVEPLTFVVDADNFVRVIHE